MKYKIYGGLMAIALAIGISSCSDDIPEQDISEEAGKMKIEFSFSHPDATRATETSFESGDVVGVFLCESHLPLETGGNVLNNEKLRFNGSTWATSLPAYWDRGLYNVYAYYPYKNNIESISDLSFEVERDQSGITSTGMNGYEASDFMFASGKSITASASPVPLNFKHIMSKLTIRLIKGEEYEGELPSTATVVLHNVATKATIDLAAGVATKDMYAEPKSIIARQASATSYTAIVVPQRIDNRVPLVEVIINDISYMFESKFQFKAGMHHIVSMVIEASPEQTKINIGGEITNWN